MNVHLGYEIGSGKPVAIPLRNMVVTGQTQESGKTTTLEALITRANVPAVAFITKRGEATFTSGRRIQPYFRERADWQFVASVLEAAMRERLKFERAWIMRASKGARTLADVQRNVRKLMETAKGISADVYLTLDAYLEIVVPRVASVKFSSGLELSPGINVLDLSDRDTFPPELQSLVMRSVLEWIYEKCKDTITIIPEAWEFIPQGRGSPVKLSAVELIRKGSGLRDYVWLDSQDIGGVEKELLRSCPVWLLGVQREANEIKRVLGSIPAGMAKPKQADVATLEKGQFFACWGKHVFKTYVQPAWVNESDAVAIARGQLSIDDLKPPTRHKPKEHRTVDDSEARALREENKQLRDEVAELNRHISHLASKLKTPAPIEQKIAAPDPSGGVVAEIDFIYKQVVDRLRKEAPAIIKLIAVKPEIELTIERQTVQTNLKELRGMIAKLLSEGFLDQSTSGNAVWKECQRRWSYGGNSARAYEQLDQLNALGFVTKEEKGYQAVPDMKVNILKS